MNEPTTLLILFVIGVICAVVAVRATQGDKGYDDEE